MAELRKERPQVRRMVIDPAAANARAVRAYAKAGFRMVRPVCAVEHGDGPVTIMTLDLEPPCNLVRDLSQHGAHTAVMTLILLGLPLMLGAVYTAHQTRRVAPTVTSAPRR